MIIRSGDELYDGIEVSWGLSGEPAIVTHKGLRYRRVVDNDEVRYVELPRESDPADPTGKWTKYYGPANVAERRMN